MQHDGEIRRQSLIDNSRKKNVIRVFANDSSVCDITVFAISIFCWVLRDIPNERTKNDRNRDIFVRNPDFSRHDV